MPCIKMSVCGLVIGSLLVACSPGQAAQETGSNVTTEAISTASPTPVPVIQAPTPTTIVSPTPPEPTRMVIWWPEPLSPLDNSDAADLLSQQISAFQTAQGNIEVELRLKAVDGLGGIMSTLRAASPVAPGALPDLTLLRRSDLQAAVQAGLVYPLLTNELSSTIMDDLYPAAQALGQVDGQMYGLAYMLEAQHMAFQPQGSGQPPATFDDFLNAGITFALPVAQTSQINGVLLTQYLDAGGKLPQDGLNDIDPDALLQVLQFYEQAVVHGLIDPAALNYASPADYQAALVSGTLDAGVVTSTRFLNLLKAGTQLDFGPVPTASGATVGQVDGWILVITTSSADRQGLAMRFLNWMLDASRQGDYSRTINMIPSQRDALQTWPESNYLDFVRQLLDNALLPLSDSEGGAIARAVQNALVSVLSGESTATKATADLIERLSS